MIINDVLQNFWKTCKKILDFKTRANRKEYIFFHIVLLILSIISLPIKNINVFELSIILLIPLILYNLLIILISFSLCIRRLHDCNLRGWWYLFYGLLMLTIYFYIVGKNDGTSVSSIIFGYISIIIMMLFFMIKKGTPGPNRFGEPPE